MAERFRIMLRVREAQSRDLKQDVGVVRANLAIFDCFLDEMREDLAECRGERHNILLAELHDSKETSHSIQVLILVEELADVLQKLAHDFLTHISVI